MTTSTANSQQQQELKYKQIPIDEWSTREQLCLASSVLRSGDQNWVSVSRSLKPFIEPNRPADWFSQKNCALQYSSLLEKAGAHKRKRAERQSSSGSAVVESQGETPGEIILKQLTQERIEELQQIIESTRNDYRRSKRELELLKSGKLSSRFPELLKEIEESKKKKLADEELHVKWLDEREKRKQQQQEALKLQLLRASQRGSAKESRLIEPMGIDGLPPVPRTPGPESADEESLDVTSVTPAAAAPTPSSPLLTSLLRSPITQTPTSQGLATSSAVAKLNFATASTAVSGGIAAGIKDQAPATTATTTTTVAAAEKAAEPVPSVSAPARTLEPAAGSSADTPATKPVESEPMAKVQDKEEVKREEEEQAEMEVEHKNLTEEIVEEIIHEVFGEEVITELNMQVPEEEEQPERFETPLPMENPPSNFNIEVEIPASSTPVEEVREESVEMKLEKSPVDEKEGKEEVEAKESKPEPEKAEEELPVEKEESGSTEEPPSEGVDQSAQPETEKEVAKEVVPEAEVPKSVEREPEPVTEEEPEAEEPAGEAPPSLPEESAPEKLAEEKEPEAVVIKTEPEAESPEETPSRRSLRSSRKKQEEEEKSGPVTRRGGGKTRPEAEAPTEPEMEEVDTTPVATSKKRPVPSSLPIPSPAPSSGLDSVPNSPTSSISTLPEDERDYRTWKKSIMLVWREIASHKNASLFAKPITDEQAPGYRSIIRRPMDLATIKKNIDTGAIRTTAEFHRDVTLMFVNAIFYNSAEEDVSRMAKEMHAEVNTIIQEFINTQLLVQSSEVTRTQKRETRDSTKRTESISSHEETPVKQEETKPTRAAAKRASIALAGEDSSKKRR